MFGAIVLGAWTFAVGSAATVIGNTVYELGKMAIEVYVLGNEETSNRDAN